MITKNKRYSRADLAIELEDLFRKNPGKFTDYGKFFMFGQPRVVARFNFSLPRENRLSVVVDAAGRAVAALYFSNPRNPDHVILDRKLFSFDDVRAFASAVESILSNKKELRSKEYVEEMF